VTYANASGIALSEAVGKVRKAASVLFAADPSVRSVGVGEVASGFGFVAVRNARAPVAYSAKMGEAIPAELDGIPVQFINSQADPSSLARVPHSGPASPGVGSLIPEQQQQRPLACGLQIQNYDDDVRTGEITKGYIIIGTLGCFVKLPSNGVAILSNNHVVAGENAGIKGQDRILQPGAATFAASMHAATLTDFVQLNPSPVGASIAAGTVVLNDVDAGVATVSNMTSYSQSYLSPRAAAAPAGVGTAATGDKVHKVGRTTGLTFGTVTQISVVVGPIAYAPGGCWFQNSLVIEGDDGTTFSDHGDSGSAIVRDDGMVVGLLYAGNGTQTYACPIDSVLSGLTCTLI
jgi:hypothetical protein